LALGLVLLTTMLFNMLFIYVSSFSVLRARPKCLQGNNRPEAGRRQPRCLHLKTSSRLSEMTTFSREKLSTSRDVRRYWEPGQMWNDKDSIAAFDKPLCLLVVERDKRWIFSRTHACQTHQEGAEGVLRSGDDVWDYLTSRDASTRRLLRRGCSRLARKS
jgi:hypothetical protein